MCCSCLPPFSTFSAWMLYHLWELTTEKRWLSADATNIKIQQKRTFWFRMDGWSRKKTGRLVTAHYNDTKFPDETNYLNGRKEYITPPGKTNYTRKHCKLTQVNGKVCTSTIDSYKVAFSKKSYKKSQEWLLNPHRVWYKLTRDGHCTTAGKLKLCMNF